MKKQNFVYSLTLTIIGYLSSLIVFPHVSRVLGPEGLGRIEFVNEITHYFLLFSMLGINAVGTREIAACVSNRQKRDEAFSSIFSLSIVMTLAVCLVYIISVFFIPKFAEDKELFFVGISNVLFTSLQVEWMYRGIENFKYITIRSVIIRIIYIVCVLLFIRENEDYFLYFVFTISIIIVNAIINQSYSRHFVTFRFNLKSVKRGFSSYFKPIATLGTNNIMNSFYSTFNVVFLGIVCGKTEVGYYYVSNKIMTLCLGVISAFTLVMLPRMSNLIGEGSKKEFEDLLKRSFKVVIDFGLPLCVGLLCFAPQIVRLLSGDGFNQSIVPLRIISPVIFINAVAQVLVYQVEMPFRKDRAILIASSIGAAVGIAFNFILVEKLHVVGSALVLCLSVGSTFCFNLIYCIKNKLISFPWSYLLKAFVLTIPIVFIYIGMSLVSQDYLVVLFAGGGLCILYWMLTNFKNYGYLIKNIIAKK